MKLTLKSVCCHLTVGCLSLAPLATRANTIYNFAFNGFDSNNQMDFAGSGTFTVSGSPTIIGGAPAYQITGLTGLFNGSAMSLVPNPTFPTPTGSFFLFDDAYYPGANGFDGYGVEFAAGGNDYIISSTGALGAPFQLYEPGQDAADPLAIFSITPASSPTVPEGSNSAVLLGLSLGGVFFAGRKMFKSC